MKKIKQTAKQKLEGLVGKYIIRIGPTKHGDYLYSNKLVIFLGFSQEGDLKITHNVAGTWLYHTLAKEDFLDDLWRPVKILKICKLSDLNVYKGKYILQTRAIKVGKEHDFSYVDKPVKLIRATRYHMVVEEILEGSGKTCLRILDKRYISPLNWKLAKEQD